MSKPITKSQLANIKANANGNETVLILIAEVERLQKLAKPNRKPTTRRKRRRSSGGGGGYIGNDGCVYSL